MRAALYCRVSTIEQATEGYSIGEQKEKLSAYARAQSYSIVGVYSDEGFSGKDLNRPAMMNLMTDIKQGKIDTVLIYKLDRLSRNVSDVLYLVDLFDKYDVVFFSLHENFDLGSPFGRAGLKMMATFSELERETIVERMQMGKLARANAGKYSCPGKCPFGYRYDKNGDCFHVDETEAEMVRKMFDLYINENFTFRKLYDYFRTAYPDVKFFSNPMCCKPIIERPMYAGYFRYKGGELIPGTNFPAIISYETYLKAQAQVEINRTQRTSDNTPYLLTGLLFCGRCGNRYVGKMYERYTKKPDGTHTKHYRYRDYGCAARIKRDANYHPGACDNEIFRAEELEKYVCDFIKNIDIDDYDTMSYAPGFIDSLIAQVGAAKQSQERLLDLYVNGDIDRDAYLIRKLPLDSKINELNTLIEKESDSVKTSVTDGVANIKEKLKNFDSLSKKEKRLLMHFLIKSVVIDGENIVINLKLKK